MKRIITMALLAIAAMTTFAQDEVYKAEMEQLDKQGEAIIKQYKELMAQDPKSEQPTTKARITAYAQMLDSISNQQIELIKRIARENQNNLIPVPYIKDAMYGLGYEGLKEVLNPQAAYYNSAELANAKRLLAGYEKRAPGKSFTELTMNDMEGNTVNLSQWIGKGNYVLVDFWASWCGPCRREMPNVIACYEKYNGKGFQIVGVSFDQKKDAWIQAVQQMGMRWPQMSDLKGWKCAASEAYGVSSIPSNVLVDPKGKIVAMDLNGAELPKKLKEIYGE